MTKTLRFLQLATLSFILIGPLSGQSSVTRSTSSHPAPKDRGLFDYSLFAKNRLAVRASDTIGDLDHRTLGNVGIAGMQDEACSPQPCSFPSLTMNRYYVGGDLVQRGALLSSNPTVRAPIDVRMSGIGGTVLSSEYLSRVANGNFPIFRFKQPSIFSGVGGGAFGRVAPLTSIAVIAESDTAMQNALNRAARQMDEVAAKLAALPASGRVEKGLAFTPFRSPFKCFDGNGNIVPSPNRCEWRADLTFTGMHDPRVGAAAKLNVFDITAEELARAQNVLIRGSDKDVFVINVRGKTTFRKYPWSPFMEASMVSTGFHVQTVVPTDRQTIAPQPRRIIFNFVDAETVHLSLGGMHTEAAVEWGVGTRRYATPGVGIPGTFIAARALVAGNTNLITGALMARTVVTDAPGDVVQRTGSAALTSTQINGDCFDSGDIPELGGIGCGAPLPIPPPPGKL